MKNQTRRKAPKIAPLIVLTVLFTIIPIYYPFIRLSQNKLLSSGSSRECFDDPINPTEVSVSDWQQQKIETYNEESEPRIPKEEPDRWGNSHSQEKELSSEKEVTRRQPRKSGRRKRNAKRSPASPVIKLPSETSPKVQEINANRGHSDGHGNDDETCDLFSGEWVPNPEAPYYTNMSCWGIQEHQNCMKYGRPDAGFMQWKWKPDGCSLPVFDPYEFLELVRGKSLAFVGDSVARNHMQSLLCLLSRVAYPLDVSNTTDENYKRWEYRDYNFTIQIFWSPYLVRTKRTDPNDVTQPFNLYLDEFDEGWTNKIEAFDYVIISAGQWFFRPSMFYLKRRLIGCLYCPQETISHKPASFSYRRAFRTAFTAINSLKNYKGVTFLRTYAPSHFEGGPWDKGGDCVRTRPFRRNETVLEGYSLEMYSIQMQEFKIASREGKRSGAKFKLMDMTQAMLLRPDGHPSKYGHWPSQNVALAKDCVHWCLPGPIDTWNDFLLEMLKKESR